MFGIRGLFLLWFQYKWAPALWPSEAVRCSILKQTFFYPSKNKRNAFVISAWPELTSNEVVIENKLLLWQFLCKHFSRTIERNIRTLENGIKQKHALKTDLKELSVTKLCIFFTKWVQNLLFAIINFLKVNLSAKSVVLKVSWVKIIFPFIRTAGFLTKNAFTIVCIMHHLDHINAKVFLRATLPCFVATLPDW